MRKLLLLTIAILSVACEKEDLMDDAAFVVPPVVAEVEQVPQYQYLEITELYIEEAGVDGAAYHRLGYSGGLIYITKEAYDSLEVGDLIGYRQVGSGTVADPSRVEYNIDGIGVSEVESLFQYEATEEVIAAFNNALLEAGYHVFPGDTTSRTYRISSYTDGFLKYNHYITASALYTSFRHWAWNFTLDRTQEFGNFDNLGDALASADALIDVTFEEQQVAEAEETIAQEGYPLEPLVATPSLTRPNNHVFWYRAYRHAPNSNMIYVVVQTPQGKEAIIPNGTIIYAMDNGYLNGTTQRLPLTTSDFNSVLAYSPSMTFYTAEIVGDRLVPTGEAITVINGKINGATRRQGHGGRHYFTANRAMLGSTNTVEGGVQYAGSISNALTFSIPANHKSVRIKMELGKGNAFGDLTWSSVTHNASVTGPTRYGAISLGYSEDVILETNFIGTGDNHTSHYRFTIQVWGNDEWVDNQTISGPISELRN